MERAFLVTKESEYYKDVQEYIDMVHKQKEQLDNFTKEYGIEAVEYAVRGDGGCNCAFKEYNKNEITLYIVPKGSDEEKYKKQLLKPLDNGLRQFRKSSKIAKEFQQFCVDNEVIINILQPDLRDYLKSIDWVGYSVQRVPCDEGYYMRVSSELLKESDNPKGFIPIKLSEFYTKLEEYKERKED